MVILGPHQTLLGALYPAERCPYWHCAPSYWSILAGPDLPTRTGVCPRDHRFLLPYWHMVHQVVETKTAHSQASPRWTISTTTGPRPLCAVFYSLSRLRLFPPGLFGFTNYNHLGRRSDSDPNLTSMEAGTPSVLPAHSTSQTTLSSYATLARRFPGLYGPT